MEQEAAAGGDGLLAWRAVGAAEAGDQARATAMLRRALALGASGEPDPAAHSEIDLETPVDLRRPPIPASGGRWNRAERCLLVLAAHRAGDRLAADHFSRTLETGGPAVASVATGLAVVGPVAWFRGLGALATGDLARADGLFERADEQARRHDAPTWRLRALAGRAEAALAGHDQDRAERHLAEAAGLTGDSGAGWFDRWLLQSTSNRFATR